MPNFNVDVEQAKTTNAYISRNGFVEVPILRGLTEVANVYNVIHPFGFFCGGYVRYMCSPQKKPVPAVDLDIYGSYQEAFEELKQIFATIYQMHIKHENNMAITYTRIDNKDHPFFAAPTIQLIKPVIEGRIVSTGTIEEVLGNFDFTVVRAAYIGNNKAIVDADFMHDEKELTLRIKNIHCPISTTLRCMKYASKGGYFLPPTQALKLFIDWSNRPQEYRNKLAEYLQLANGGIELTKEQVDELEGLMRID